MQKNSGKGIRTNMTNVDQNVVGRTRWDVLHEIFSKGFPWLLVVAGAVLIGYIVAHPNVANEWNVFFSTLIAKYVPRKRKKTFERRVDLTLQKARSGIKQSMPEYVQQFLPYSLKVEWVEPNNEEESIDSIKKDKQIILYVPSYKDEEKQSVNIMYNYCMKGFAEKPKCYMKDADRKASDLLMTGKLAQNAGPHVFDYYNRVFVNEMLQTDAVIKSSYEELKKIDVDGLFLPIFINEIDKYAGRIYGTGDNSKPIQVIDRFKQYLLRIISKKQEENVELDFDEDGISVHIELAVGKDVTGKKIDRIIDKLETLINKGKISTIYVLASGAKMESANTIVTGLEERVVQDINEPKVTQYKRFTRMSEGKESICFEINVR